MSYTVTLLAHFSTVGKCASHPSAWSEYTFSVRSIPATVLLAKDKDYTEQPQI